MLRININPKKVISVTIGLFAWLVTYGISIVTTSTPVTCFGGTNGQITVTVSGSTNNLNYYLYDNIPIPGPATLLSQSGATPLTTYTFNTNAMPAGSYYIYVVESVTGASTGNYVTVTQSPSTLTASI